MRTHLSLLAALWALSTPAPARAGAVAAPSRVAAVTAPATSIAVSFLLDPRLSGPTYGGEKWVSPREYTGVNGQGAVDVRAQAADAQGRPVKAPPLWTVSDPEVLTVSASRGARITLTVKRAGTAVVTIDSGGATRSLAVTAVRVNGLLRLTISQ